eukprot:scaffold125680_cov36-Tisochrysis_lutea.AAC.1
MHRDNQVRIVVAHALCEALCASEPHLQIDARHHRRTRREKIARPPAHVGRGVEDEVKRSVMCQAARGATWWLGWTSEMGFRGLRLRQCWPTRHAFDHKL